MDELAKPYAKHLCEHLKRYPKQITSAQSRFLEQLKLFNNGDISNDEMIARTVQLGFNNVIDAFHNIPGNAIGTRFYIDERESGGRITLTDDLFRLGEQCQAANLYEETEARWKLVEAAWANNISRNLMLVEYEDEGSVLIGASHVRRTPLTSARPALNGYQKGRCFYCYREIAAVPGEGDLAEVDHFYPHRLKACDSRKPIDGVANLVLACVDCNRGPDGKFDRLPSIELLERLYRRNEYLITSHHPLRETLISQTGNTAAKRQKYLQDAYNCATLYLGSKHKWQPTPQGIATF